MSGQGFAQPGHGWSHGMSSEPAVMVAMSDFADASAMPAGMATSASSMARTPRLTNQRCSDLFTP